MASTRAAGRVIAERAGSALALSWPHRALAISLCVHLVAGAVVSGWSLAPRDLPPLAPAPEVVWLRDLVAVVPPPAPAELRVEPEAAPAPPVRLDEPPPAAPPPELPVRAVIVPAPSPVAPSVPTESPGSVAPGEPTRPQATAFELDELRRRAAADAVAARVRNEDYRSFSVDDLAPPRATPEPERKSIFDGTGASRPSRLAPGQARTVFGRRLRELCNVLTGGQICADRENEPSGLFPEARPEILDLEPECVEVVPPKEFAEEASRFPTTKCQLVPQEDVGRFPHEASESQ